MRTFGWLLLVVAATCCAGTSKADLETGLIAHYTLDGHAQDASPHANHGSPGATLVATTDRFGTPGAAYEFNGTNSYITVPNSASLASPTTAITMSAWVLLVRPGLDEVDGGQQRFHVSADREPDLFRRRLQ